MYCKGGRNSIYVWLAKRQLMLWSCDINIMEPAGLCRLQRHEKYIRHSTAPCWCDMHTKYISRVFKNVAAPRYVASFEFKRIWTHPFSFVSSSNIMKKKLRGFGPLANYANRATYLNLGHNCFAPQPFQLINRPIVLSSDAVVYISPTESIVKY
jgi:hypothetical protein